jgi:inner membrane protein
MPTVITHPAAALALAPWFRRLPRWTFIAGVIGTVVPDLDVTAFALGIPYAHPLGHRGFTHSLVFAALFAAVVGYVTRVRSNTSFFVSFVFVFLATASHGLLDAMTSGGLGVGFFIPFSNARLFLPWRPIRVSPIGVGRFAEKAVPVLLSEALWVWLPAVVIGSLGFARRRLGTSD